MSSDAFAWQSDVGWAIYGLEWDPRKALVAGGRALQMLFPQYPTKDTDVFFVGDFVSHTACQWLKQNATLLRPGVEDRQTSFDPAWPDQGVRSLGSWRVPERKLDLVFLSAPSRAAVLDNFDIGVCQVGWQPDDGRIVLTEKARQDITRQEVTSYRMRYADRTNHRERLRKYSERTGWPIRVADAGLPQW